MNGAKFVTVSSVQPACFPLPHSHTALLSLQLLPWAGTPAYASSSASPSVSLHPIYPVSWTPYSSKRRVQRVSPKCFPWGCGVTEAGAWHGADSSLCAEFCWCERHSTPVPPGLCLASSFGKSLRFFQALVQSFLARFFYFNTSFASLCLQ